MSNLSNSHNLTQLMQNNANSRKLKATYFTCVIVFVYRSPTRSLVVLVWPKPAQGGEDQLSRPPLHSMPIACVHMIKVTFQFESWMLSNHLRILEIVVRHGRGIHYIWIFTSEGTQKPNVSFNLCSHCPPLSTWLGQRVYLEWNQSSF